MFAAIAETDDIKLMGFFCNSIVGLSGCAICRFPQTQMKRSYINQCISLHQHSLNVGVKLSPAADYQMIHRKTRSQYPHTCESTNEYRVVAAWYLAVCVMAPVLESLFMVSNKGLSDPDSMTDLRYDEPGTFWPKRMFTHSYDKSVCNICIWLWH